MLLYYKHHAPGQLFNSVSPGRAERQSQASTAIPARAVVALQGQAGRGNQCPPPRARLERDHATCGAPRTARIRQRRDPCKRRSALRIGRQGVIGCAQPGTVHQLLPTSAAGVSKASGPSSNQLHTHQGYHQLSKSKSCYQLVNSPLSSCSCHQDSAQS